MKEHNFTIYISIPKSIDVIDASAKLYEQGCGDALIGMGKEGVLAINFAREDSSKFEAIKKAKIQILMAIPQSTVMSISIEKEGETVEKDSNG